MTPNVDALASQFTGLRKQLRKPFSTSALTVLKMGRVVSTAKDVLNPADRMAFRKRCGLGEQSLFTSYTAIGNAFEWLKPFHKDLPPTYTVLRRIAQRLDATSLPTFIESGVVSPFMQNGDVKKLPLKHPGRGVYRRKPKRQDLSVTIQMAQDGFDVKACQKFLVRLISFLKDEQPAFTSLDSVFELSKHLEKALKPA